METNGGGSSSRARWTEQRRRKEPNLYDEWLKEEKMEKEKSPRRQSVPMMPLRHGDTASLPASTNAATVRSVTPEKATNTDEENSAVIPDRGAASFERTFIPRTTTTIIGGPAALSAASSPYGRSNRNRKLMKEQQWAREQRLASHSPPSSRNGSSVAGMLARASSKTNGSASNGHRMQHAVPMGERAAAASNGYRAHVAPAGERDSAGSARPRTRTLEETRRDRSPNDVHHKSRSRIGSVNAPDTTAKSLASIPKTSTTTTTVTTISQSSSPAMSSFGPPVQAVENSVGQRSASRTSSNTADSLKSNSSGNRKIWYLMQTLKGVVSGSVGLRTGWEKPWNNLFCYVKRDSGRLGCEYQDRGHRTLVKSLKGCSVKPHADGETLFLEVTVPQTETRLHLKLQTQTDFDSWFAALLWWQKEEPKASTQDPVVRQPSSPCGSTSVRPELPPRTSSARGQRNRADSSKSDRRKSVVSSKEAPVIKIGKMIVWDTSMNYSHTPGSSGMGAVGQPVIGRPQAFRTQSYSSKRWKRVSGQLRENGEFKLHSDADNALISVVQLSHLSRCAIQRLDPSVLENDHCIAIYPQYTSNANDDHSGIPRPILLSLESRVLFEVWFVLFRAFTIPQLYGPPIAAKATQEESDNEQRANNTDVESLLASTTSDMFRMERTMSIRIVQAKMYPPPTNASTQDTGFSGGHNREAQTMANNRLETHGYYAEVLLDGETRAKTVVKYEGLNPMWGDGFEFLDLPPVLGTTNIIIKRRPPNTTYARSKQESRTAHEAWGLTDDQHGGYSGSNFDMMCGKVEISLQDLEEEKELEKNWPIRNGEGQQVGSALIKTRIDEGVILMQRDYKPLSELLHRFTNGLTLQIAQMVPGELTRVSHCLLNIFQVSGKVSDWISALVEEEIDGIHKETPISKLRYSRRIGSDASHDTLGTGSGNSDRELIVRDMNKNANLEANLLFRGNTLLTKCLEAHMRRVGKEYLEQSLGAKLREINERQLDSEVDPSKITNPQHMDAHWKRLLTVTKEVWNSIWNSRKLCPVELRVIFRHIRACAEDRYGDFMRSVLYTSVSGFLFLRFFGAAIMNPKLFGLINDDVSLTSRRTFLLIAKSINAMSNMSTLGSKEPWMEPMNAFVSQNRESFKSFIDEVCYVPSPLSVSVHSNASRQSPSQPLVISSAETNLAYTTPMTIMQRLPPTSREGFPSLPYLIDQARAFADLIQLWLEATTEMSGGVESTASAKSHAELMSAIKASEGDLMAFHETCTKLHKRTQECLTRAERAEKRNSALSFRWDELIDQLQVKPDLDDDDELHTPPASTLALDALAETVASDPTIIPSSSHSTNNREWDIVQDDDHDEDDDDFGTRLYDTTPSQSGSQAAFEFGSTRDRPGSSGLVSSLRDSLRRAQGQGRDSASPSQSHAASASASNVSSAVSSDTEHTTGTTALPKYNRDRDVHERREAAKQRIQQQVEAAARQREQENERRKHKPSVVSALRKKNRREAASSSGSYGSQGYSSHG